MSRKKRYSLFGQSRNLSVEAMELRLLPSTNPIQITPASLDLTEGQSFSGPVATFTDSDQNHAPGQYTAEINWGDGTNSRGRVVRDGDHFDVLGKHTYPETGNEQITVAVQDKDGDTASNAINTQTNLVTNSVLVVSAAHVDSDLQNAWGIAFNPSGAIWVADNHTGKSTLYDTAGVKANLVVSIPGPGGIGQGSPTGEVFNGTSDFGITVGNVSSPAKFVFATEDGTLAAWNPAVGTTAQLPVDNSNSDAVYKGLATGSVGTTNYLYATNFHAGTIDVFDKNFHHVTLRGGFVDQNLQKPKIDHPGFAPFGIQNIGGKLYVTYALQKSDQHDDQSGAGNGFVDVFKTDGTFVRRLASHGALNSPWGLALAPANFGPFSQALLVGNFGDGRIQAYNPATGQFLGQLADANGPIEIDGLWALAFGDGNQGRATNDLFFTAGPNEETDGLFGRINLDATSGTSAMVEEGRLTGIPHDSNAHVNQLLSTTVATFHDQNPNGNPQEFHASIDWGDRRTATDGLVNKHGNQFKVSGTHTYTQAGRFKVTITVTEEDGPPLMIESFVTVL